LQSYARGDDSRKFDQLLEELNDCQMADELLISRERNQYFMDVPNTKVTLPEEHE